jgi:hypothetical protein
MDDAVNDIATLFTFFDTLDLIFEQLLVVELPGSIPTAGEFLLWQTRRR